MQDTSPSQPQITFLPLREVCRRVALKKSSIYDGVKRGTFPPPVRVSARAVRWTNTSVDEFIKQKIAASRAGQ